MSLLNIDLGLFEVNDMAPWWALLAVSSLVIAFMLRRNRGANLEWIQGHGYIGLWRRLHAAEEATLMFCPLETAVAVARFDEERLRGSSITNADALIFLLQQARGVLVAAGGLNAIWSVPVPSRVAGPAATPPITPGDEVMAREVIRQVRHSINEYRDESWGGLVRARNNLYGSNFVTTLFGLLIVTLCAVVSTFDSSFGKTQVIAAAAFYFTGAIVGLINQLRLDQDSSSAVEDYGLSWARRINTPLLSGLAGLAAVVLIPMLSALTNVNDIQEQMPRLQELLNVGEYTKGIAFAAIFGLTPTALLGRLQSEAERYKSAITNSSAANSGPP